MVFVIVFTIVLLIVLYLLFTPIILNINTLSKEYYLQFSGLFKANWELHELELFRIRLRVFYINFFFYPLRDWKIKKPKKSKWVPSRRPKLGIREYYQLARTFQVKRFSLDMDTGDYTLNAKLFPVFVFLNNRVGDMHINYNGRNQLVLRVENRPITIIKKLITLKN